MNNFKLKSSMRLILLSVICPLFFCTLAYGNDSNNPCAKYQDPQLQAKCVNFLNAAASSGQSMVDKYKITPPPAQSAAPTSAEQSYNPEQQAQSMTATSAAPAEVTVSVQPVPVQQDTSNMTPWQVLSKGHGKAVIMPTNTTPESSAATPDHVNIYK